MENALYIVSTPIGNVGDITIRALDVLKNVDYIFCEDTRVTNKLLEQHNLGKKSLFVYNDFSSENERSKVIKLLKEGKSVALVSDAGTPLVSDPGFKLVRECKELGIKVIPVPGSSALLATLVACGLPSDKFFFNGFLSEKEGDRKKELEGFKYRTETIILYESPKRILFTLEEIEKTLGNVSICIAREITKTYEEIKTDRVLGIINYYKDNPNKIKGEFVVALKNDSIEQNHSVDIVKIKVINESLKAFMKPKEIADFIIKIGYGKDKKEIYDILIKGF